MKMRDIFGIFFEGTPLLLTVLISIFSALLVVYFFLPKQPKVVYSFDAEEFKKALVLRAALRNDSTDVVGKITEELRKRLDYIAKRDNTVVINKRALISNGMSDVKVVDITKQVEKELLDKYLPLSASKLLEELNKKRK
ncbi:hypothetical protein [Desulfurobacterium sp.]